MLFLMSLYTFLWKYTAYDIIDMVNECAAPKCQTGYTSSTGKLYSFHFPLKNEDLNKKWIHFVNRKDWVPTKHCFMRVAFGRYLQKYKKMHEFKLVDKTSSYDLFCRTC